MADYAFFMMGAAVLGITTVLVVAAIVVGCVAKRFLGVIALILALSTPVTCGLTILPALVFSVLAVRRKAFAKLGWTAMCVSILLPLGVIASLLLHNPGNWTTTPPTEEIIQKTNAERRRIGLRPIKSDWHFYGKEFGTEKWKPTPEGYLCKTVTMGPDGSLLSEDDLYYTGRTYQLPFGEGTDWEFLTTDYDYSNLVVWVRYVGTNSGIERLVEPFETGSTNFARVMTAADEALDMLGMSRLE